MTKDELLSAIAGKVMRPKAEVGLVLDGLRAAVTEAVRSGETVVVAELVKLAPHDAPARSGRNPKTGAQITIPARKTVKAKASAALVRALT